MEWWWILSMHEEQNLSPKAAGRAESWHPRVEWHIPLFFSIVTDVYGGLGVLGVLSLIFFDSLDLCLNSFSSSKTFCLLSLKNASFFLFRHIFRSFVNQDLLLGYSLTCLDGLTESDMRRLSQLPGSDQSRCFWKTHPSQSVPSSPWVFQLSHCPMF